MMKNGELKMVMAVNGAMKREADMRSTLETVKIRMQSMAAEIADSVKVQSTGWFVLLRKLDDGWESLGVMNPDRLSDEEIEVEWDLCLPIPDPQTVPEFQGW